MTRLLCYQLISARLLQCEITSTPRTTFTFSLFLQFNHSLGIGQLLYRVANQVHYFIAEGDRWKADIRTYIDIMSGREMVFSDLIERKTVTYRNTSRYHPRVTGIGRGEIGQWTVYMFSTLVSVSVQLMNYMSRVSLFGFFLSRS